MATIDIYTKQQADVKLATKQDTLVSGTNIKTVNGESILGSGNIQAGGLNITTYEVPTPVWNGVLKVTMKTTSEHQQVTTQMQNTTTTTIYNGDKDFVYGQTTSMEVTFEDLPSGTYTIGGYNLYTMGNYATMTQEFSLPGEYTLNEDNSITYPDTVELNGSFDS